METFLVSDMQIFTDPKASQGAEMASIRIHLHDSPIKRVVQDYREISVLNAFSKVGGLWAFISGLFATIFGSSILRTVLGMVLSLFSIVVIAEEVEFRNKASLGTRSGALVPDKKNP